ncbi:hypothetical protein EsDP_00001650 [Epichloe bromicola]|uniref:Peptide hydrolase n=1 Tax=Epichloe bromicola TaxID=79588 RepID=A0ABQ0CIH0_9HYPO
MRCTSLLAPLLVAVPALAIRKLADDDLRNIPSPGDDFDIHKGKLLAPILIPRVPGTPGNAKVQQHFVDFFKSSLPKWELTWQNSTQKTPLSKGLAFSNLVFRRDPPGSRPGDVSRLTLVAHFDSLADPPGFIGAIDSAAPCAMLMHVARSIDEALTAKWNKAEEEEEQDDDGLDEKHGVQILFLDGEEAFVKWSATDSLYGARSLAAEWESQFHTTTSLHRTPLDAISLFVLLDLLGTAEPSVPSYFLPTHWTYQNMAALEKRMRDLNLLESKPGKPFLWDSQKEAEQFHHAGIEDDHIPFMLRGVDVLHLIPSPFPFDIWHKKADDGEHLDLPTVRDWAKIVTAFTAEWLDLGNHLPKKVPVAEPGSETSGSTLGKRTEL